MAKIATRGQKPSDFIAFEDDLETGYTRETVTVTLEAGMDRGAVLVLNAGKYAWCNTAAVANVANGVAFLVQSVDGLSAGDQQLAVLIRGEAAVMQKGLLWKGTVSAGDQTTVLNKAKAQGILTRTQV